MHHISIANFVICRYFRKSHIISWCCFFYDKEDFIFHKHQYLCIYIQQQKTYLIMSNKIWYDFDSSVQDCSNSNGVLQSCTEPSMLIYGTFRDNFVSTWPLPCDMNDLGGVFGQVEGRSEGLLFQTVIAVAHDVIYWRRARRQWHGDRPHQVHVDTDEALECGRLLLLKHTPEGVSRREE